MLADVKRTEEVIEIPVDQFLLKISKEHLKIFGSSKISFYQHKNQIAPVCTYFCLTRGKVVTDRVGRAIALHEAMVSFNELCRESSVLHKDGNHFNCLIDNLDVKPNCFYHFLTDAKPNNTGFRGVFFDNRDSTYRAEIYFMGKRIRLGRHKTAFEAFNAYKKKAIELYGDYAIQVFNRVNSSKELASY